MDQISPSFLKTGTTDEEGKQESAKPLLYSSARTGECSGEHILRTRWYEMVYREAVRNHHQGWNCMKKT